MDSIGALEGSDMSAFPFEDLLKELTYEDYLLFNANVSEGNDSYFDMGDYVFDTDRLNNRLLFPFRPDESVDEDDVYRNYIFLGLNVVSLVFGLFGNISSLCVFLKIKRLGLNVSVFLMNLILSDVSVLLLCIPLTILERFKGDLIHGKIACKLVPFIQGCSVYSNIFAAWVLPSLLILRKCFNCRPRCFTTTSELLIIFGICLLSAALSCPFIFFTIYTSKNIMGFMDLNFCEEIWPREWQRNAYNIVLFFLTCGIPTFSLITASIMRFRKRYENGVMSNSYKTTFRAILLLLILNIILWAPYQIMIIYMDMNYQKKDLAKVVLYGFPFAQWLVHSRPVLHPLICFTSVSFRDFRKLLRRRLASGRYNSLGLFTRDWYVHTTIDSHNHSNDGLVMDKVTVV